MVKWVCVATKVEWYRWWNDGEVGLCSDKGKVVPMTEYSAIFAIFRDKLQISRLNGILAHQGSNFMWGASESA